MSFVLKIFKAALAIVLPNRVYAVMMDRVKRTYMVLTGTPRLKVFWKIIFWPINLIIELLIGVLKTALIWILPKKLLNDLRYIFKQVYIDMTQNQAGLRLTAKRAALCYELFTKGAEKKVTYGELNPDKTFYVLRPYYYLERNELTLNVSNLLFHYYRNLQHLAWAVEHNWIPVVDWENYGPFPHEEDYPINGTENCWEYYWNQPSKYTLQEVYQSKNVILSVQNTRDTPYIPSCSFRVPLQEQAEDYAKRCPKYDQLITLNELTENYIKDKQNRLFPSNARILGVSIRGTSYGVAASSLNTNGHPIQPNLNKLIQSIHTAMEEWDMEYVFIACELEGVINEIKNVFGTKTIVLPRKRYIKAPQRGDVEKGMDPLYIPGQKYQTNLDYVTEMVLLSRCTSLLAAMSSGVRAAIIWNQERYENMRIFENGLW